jgi:hypothetical protein
MWGMHANGSNKGRWALPTARIRGVGHFSKPNSQNPQAEAFDLVVNLTFLLAEARASAAKQGAKLRTFTPAQ